MNDRLNSDLEESLFNWLLDAKYWLGYCAAICERNWVRGEELEFFWYISYTRVRVGIRANKKWFGNDKLQQAMLSFHGRLFDVLLPKDIIIAECYEEIEKTIKRFFPNIVGANTWALCEAGESENCRTSYGFIDICIKDGNQYICSNCSEKRTSEKLLYKGYIYIIGNKEKKVYKIGLSQQPRERYKAFKTKLPFEIEIIHQIGADNMTKAEQKLHKYFYEKKTHGEWFELDEQDISFISRLKEFLDGEFFTQENEPIAF